MDRTAVTHHNQSACVSEAASNDVVNQTADLIAHGEKTIEAGSKSFAMASRLFRPAMRDDVRMFYAWCRHCDDVIDGQTLGGDAPDATLSQDEQKLRLDGLKRDTILALEGKPVGHPAFDGFCLVARKHQIPHRYPMDLLDGFAMDVNRHNYATLGDTLHYCYGVAGVVGVMMAIVMGVSPDRDDVLDRACDLGLAFQLTNICRDIIDDAQADRLYLPHEFLQAVGVEPTAPAILAPENREAVTRAVTRLLDEADRYYESAMEGVPFLPTRAGAAVVAARNIYRDIGRVIRERGNAAWEQRAYTSKRRKTYLALRACLKVSPNIILPRPVKTKPNRMGLWSRPGNRI